MHKEAVLHICDSSYVYAVDDKRMVFKLRAKKGDLREVKLFYGDKYDKNMMEHICEAKLTLAYSDEFHDYFETEVELEFNRLAYCFKLYDGEQTCIYAQERFTDGDQLNQNRMFLFPYICREDINRSKTEWEELVVYQIFVDRFNKNDKDQSWYKLPGVLDIYGGNLDGIIDKLGYLNELGINCIYLTPIFESPTNHKYNTVNYYSVDNAFGEERTLRLLIETCHENGIKVILDAVFNHTSDQFFAFKDIIKNGKYSKYYDWYFVSEDGLEYETFGYSKGMPKLNTGNKEVSDYLVEIGKYWVREFDIDGWRLDVANEIDHKFWRKFREEIKRIKDDAIIIGEVWDFGESYLQGDQYDSIMNYPFMNASLEFFARRSIDAIAFDFSMNHIFARYKKNVRKLLLNLLGSHDTSRFLYECGENMEKLKLAALFQMTCIGIPMVYYGDEAGLTGKNDPDCRRTIDFDHVNGALFQWYSKLIQIRRETSALMHGEFRTVATRDGVYAFQRFTEEETVVVVLNSSGINEIVELVVDDEFTSGKDLLWNKEILIVDHKLVLRLPAYGAEIVRLVKQVI